MYIKTFAETKKIYINKIYIPNHGGHKINHLRLCQTGCLVSLPWLNKCLTEPPNRATQNNTHDVCIDWSPFCHQVPWIIAYNTQDGLWTIINQLAIFFNISCNVSFLQTPNCAIAFETMKIDKILFCPLLLCARV